MKEYVFLRYANQPNPHVTALLSTIVKHGTRPIFQPLPGIMITVFKSDMSEADIRAKFARHLDGVIFDLVEKKNPVSARPNNDTHNPNRPSKQQLESDLQRAIDEEDFEKASQLRDQIQQLYGGAQQTGESMITSLLNFKVFLESSKINENLERIVNVQIIDRKADINTDPYSVDIKFNTIDDLDTAIDNYINNELQLTKVDVTIDDFNNVLTDDEKDTLIALNYEIY